MRSETHMNLGIFQSVSSLVDPFGLIGQVLDGQFRVDKFVGEGGFSVVYRGQHVGLDEPIAIKCLKLPMALGSAFVDSFVRRFKDEGRLHYRLSQGNLFIVRSLASGTSMAPATGALVPYIILEWLEGRSLANDLEVRRTYGDRGRSVNDMVKLLDPSVDALAYAHAQGVVHRDINPGNLFLTQTPQGTKLKVLDFGVAKIVIDHLALGPRAQTIGQIRIFSPTYAAPEQFDESIGAIGPWTDVYALALIATELLRDAPAIEGEHLGEFHARAMDPETRPTPRTLGVELGNAVEAAFAHALDVVPGHRPHDAGEFWGELKNAMQRDTAAGVDYAKTPRGLDHPPPPVTVNAPSQPTLPDEKSRKALLATLVDAGPIFPVPRDLPPVVKAKVVPPGKTVGFRELDEADDDSPDTTRMPDMPRELGRVPAKAVPRPVMKTGSAALHATPLPPAPPAQTRAAPSAASVPPVAQAADRVPPPSIPIISTTPVIEPAPAPAREPSPPLLVLPRTPLPLAPKGQAHAAASFAAAQPRARVAPTPLPPEPLASGLRTPMLPLPADGMSPHPAPVGFPPPPSMPATEPAPMPATEPAPMPPPAAAARNHTPFPASTAPPIPNAFEPRNANTKGGAAAWLDGPAYPPLTPASDPVLPNEGFAAEIGANGGYPPSPEFSPQGYPPQYPAPYAQHQQHAQPYAPQPYPPSYAPPQQQPYAAPQAPFVASYTTETQAYASYPPPQQQPAYAPQPYAPNAGPQAYPPQPSHSSYAPQPYPTGAQPSYSSQQGALPHGAQGLAQNAPPAPTGVSPTLSVKKSRAKLTVFIVLLLLAALSAGTWYANRRYHFYPAARQHAS